MYEFYEWYNKESERVINVSENKFNHKNKLFYILNQNKWGFVYFL